MQLEEMSESVATEYLSGYIESDIPQGCLAAVLQGYAEAIGADLATVSDHALLAAILNAPTGDRYDRMDHWQRATDCVWDLVQANKWRTGEAVARVVTAYQSTHPGELPDNRAFICIAEAMLGIAFDAAATRSAPAVAAYRNRAHVGFVPEGGLRGTLMGVTTLKYRYFDGIRHTEFARSKPVALSELPAYVPQFVEPGITRWFRDEIRTEFTDAIGKLGRGFEWADGLVERLEAGRPLLHYYTIERLIDGMLKRSFLDGATQAYVLYDLFLPTDWF